MSGAASPAAEPSATGDEPDFNHTIHGIDERSAPAAG